MVIENMKFTHLPDGRVDVKFRCRDCGEFVDKDVRCFQSKFLLATSFSCSKCWDLRMKEIDEERQNRKKMSVAQKIRSFFMD